MKSVLKETINYSVFKVLLVEDNLTEAELLQNLLIEAERVEVPLTHVQRVSEAIEALNQENFDAILLDLSLPDSNGLDTLTRIQECLCQCNTRIYPPIVVLTGYDDEELALQSIRTGAQDCLVKGKVDSQLLIRSLRYAIERQQRQEGLQRSEKNRCVIYNDAEMRGRGDEGKSANITQLSSQNYQQTVAFQTEVKQTEQELDCFFSLSIDLLCVAGFDGYLKHFNPAWETTLGYTTSELLALPFLEFVHPEDQEATQCEVQKLSTGKAPTINFENRYICKDGSSRWFLWTAVTFFEESSIYAVGRDITDRKHSEEVLRLSQERLQLALEGSALGLWDWNVSTGQTYFDPSWKRMLGYEVDEIENNHQSWEQLLHPEDLANVLEALNAYLEGRTPIYQVEYRMLSKSGEWQWILSHGKVFKWDESGRPVRMTGTHKDITERKALERELALREAQLNAFFASSPIGLKVLDDQMRFVQINEPLAEINGLSVGDHIGKTLREVLPDLAPNLEPLYQQVLATGKSILNMEVSGETPSRPGIVRYWMTSYFPIPGAEGCPSGVGAVVVEISDRKRTEAALQQQILREQVVGAMRSRIRRTLNLKEVLTTAVKEVRQFLQTDRTVIYRFNPDWSGVIEVESVGEGWMPLFGLDIQDHCFAQTYISQYKQGRIRAIDDIYSASLEPCHIDLLSGLEIKANLVVPLLQGETLWGLLIAHHCCSSRQWHDYEIECLRQLSVQLAIAIQQSTLYEQAQTEIAQRQRALAALRQSEARERSKAQQLEITLQELKNTQFHLIQSEKMASLGQLVAGIAHEINNPISFIYSNVAPAMEHTRDLLHLISLYQQQYPTPCAKIQDEIESLDLDFIKEDFPKLLGSMKEGASRIQHIVLSLRNFSHLDKAEQKEADLHEGIDNTLMILQNRLREQPNRAAIQVIKEFGNLPLVECYPGEMNQVFMNILSNAIDALENRIQADSSLSPKIQICTAVVRVNGQHSTDKIMIRIADNGFGIPPNVKQRVFDPFFTTKPVGKGTGLGLSISHSIVVKKHKGELYCNSLLGKGTELVIELPL